MKKNLKSKNQNQSKSLNLNSYNVGYIYIVYILYSKAINNIYFRKSKETQKKGLIYSYFPNWSWCTRFLSIACENNHKRGKKTFDWSTIFRTVFWLVGKSQWITLTPKWIYYNTNRFFCECINENDWQHLTYLPILICRK